MSRTVSLKGRIFASSATTSIPSTPIAGVSYRNASTTKSKVAQGWPFNQIVDSATFNQILYEIASVLSGLEQQGGIQYSRNTDYAVGNIVWLLDDGIVKFYTCIATNGPSTSVSEPPSAKWQELEVGSQSEEGGGFKRKIIATTNPSIIVSIGDIVEAKPVSNLVIDANTEDMYGGMADVYVDVPSGATVTAKTNGNVVFADGQSVTAGKTNHIRIEYDGLNTARMYVLDSWSNGSEPPLGTVSENDLCFLYNNFITADNKLVKIISNSSTGNCAYLDNASTGWQRVAGVVPLVSPSWASISQEKAKNGIKDDSLMLVKNYEDEIVLVSTQKIFAVGSTMNGSSSLHYPYLIKGATHNYYAHIRYNQGGVDHDLGTVNTPGSGMLTCYGGILISDGHLWRTYGNTPSLIPHEPSDAWTEDGWTMVSGCDFRDAYCYGINNGKLFMVHQHSSQDSLTHVEQVGSSNGWTAISGYSENTLKAAALGLNNGQLYIIKVLATTVISGSFVKISGMAINETTSGTLCYGYAIDNTGALFRINYAGTKMAVDGGSTGWTDIKGAYYSCPQNIYYSGGSSSGSPVEYFAIGIKDNITYLISDTTATAINFAA